MSINSNLVDVMKKEYEFELHYGKLWVTLRQTGAHITSKHQSITPGVVDVCTKKLLKDF